MVGHRDTVVALVLAAATPRFTTTWKVIPSSRQQWRLGHCIRTGMRCNGSRESLPVATLRPGRLLSLRFRPQDSDRWLKFLVGT